MIWEVKQRSLEAVAMLFVAMSCYSWYRVGVQSGLFCENSLYCHIVTCPCYTGRGDGPYTREN